MPSQTLHSHDFAPGTVVAAYLREQLTNGGPPTGTAVDSSTVAADGSLVFDGLTEGRRYVAYAGGRAVSFFMPQGSLDTLRPITGPEAQQIRTDLASVESGTVGFLNAGGVAGVDRTGASDSATGLGTALTAAAGRGLFVPFGTYKVLSGLTLPATGLTLQLDDAILDFTGLAASGTALSATGTLGSPVAVNAVAFGATSITGAAGIEAGLNVGDRIKLWSADIFDPGQTNSTNGEQCIVLSTASGVINVLGSIMGVYSTTVKIAKVTRIPLVIKGTGQILMGGTGSGHKGLVAHFANGLRIDGPKLEIRDAENTGIQLFDSADFEVGNVHVQGSTDASTGYGFSATNTCQNGRLHHSHFRKCRHWTSVNTSPTDNGGIPRHITHEQVFGQYTPAACDGFDSHAGAEYLTYDGCEGRDSGNTTFNIECASATIKNSKSFRSANTAFNLLNCTGKGAEYRVTGCEGWDSAAMGVRYGAQIGLASPAPITLDILDNVLVRCATAAAWADPGVEHRLLGARMLRNRAYDCGGSGTRTFYMTKCDECEMDNSSFQTANGLIGSRATDFTGGRFGGRTHFVSAGTGKGFYGESMTDTTIQAGTKNATGAGCEGLELDAASARCKVLGSGALREATLPVQLNGVLSHTVDYHHGAALEIYNTDANKALTPFTSAEHLVWIAPIAASRLVSISVTGAQPGMRFRVTRTAAATGAGNVTVAGVRALAVGQWCEVMFDGSAWITVGFGSL